MVYRINALNIFIDHFICSSKVQYFSAAYLATMTIPNIQYSINIAKYCIKNVASSSFLLPSYN